jgi:RHS repeat-associated protein
MEYVLGDTLGSVRQTIKVSRAITYARTYDPYGVVTSTTGSSQSPYGYTNEYTSQGLVYLRARMYSPGIGRFLTRDTWSGDYNNPLTLNAWNYTSSNPVNYLDPSGHYSIDCNTILSGWPCVKEINIFGLFPILIPVACETQTPLQPFAYSTPTATPQLATSTPGPINITPTPIQTQVYGTPTQTLTPTPTVDICERNRQEYEATVREIKFRIRLVSVYEISLASRTDPEDRQTLEFLIVNTRNQGTLFWLAAQKLLFESMGHGCKVGLWSQLPVLPWAQ